MKLPAPRPVRAVAGFARRLVWDLPYRIIVAVVLTWFRIADYRIEMTGQDAIPATGGALLAINHISYVDYLIGGYPGVRRGRFTRFMGKRELFDHRFVGPLMRAFHHIQVDRDAGAASARAAITALKAGELVGIFPEATISRSYQIKNLKTGAVRIAAAANVPLIPVVLWGTQRILAKGHKLDAGRHKRLHIAVGAPMYPTRADPDGQTAALKAAMESLLDGILADLPEGERPPQAWWVPQSYGGSAPSLEQAAADYTREREARHNSQ